MEIKMATREQKKMQKKKKKEKENRKKILAEREKRRAVVRKEREERRREKRIDRLQKEMMDFEYLPTETLEDMDDATLSQLERNAQILKALEVEYTKEIDRKKELNESLEDEGHFTLEDKMNALAQKNIAVQKEEVGMGGGADCSVGPPETAEVDVMKYEEEENS
jgi:hypothetical protein